MWMQGRRLGGHQIQTILNKTRKIIGISFIPSNLMCYILGKFKDLSVYV